MLCLMLYSACPFALLACLNSYLQTHFSDLLYQVSTHDGNLAYVYTLFDHKSYVDSDVAFQLFRYQARIWEQLPRLEKNKLPPIFPVVFYHGVSKWTVDRAFGTLFPEKTSPSLLPYLPNFQYHIIDLSGFRHLVDNSAETGLPPKE